MIKEEKIIVKPHSRFKKYPWFRVRNFCVLMI